MFIKLATCFIVAILAFAAIAGCGGDESDDAEANSTRAEFIAEADAACDKARKQASRQLQTFLNRNVETRAEVEAGYEELIEGIIAPQFEAQIEAIESASGPQNAEEAGDKLIAKVERFLDAAEADPFAYASGSPDELNEAEQLAEDLGFKRCGGNA